MIRISIAALADIISGQLYFVVNPSMAITAVCTDSRIICAHSVFFALQGDHFDGHEFVAAALEAGACVAVVAKATASCMPQILVADVPTALAQLAYWVRLQMSVTLVSLTGSNGKTSVKEMTAAILRQCGQTLATHGNLNNVIGVPLTLLRLTAADKYAVIELGANHSGEIAASVQLCQPQAVLINNVSAAHLAGFGSLDGVYKAKGEILLGLPPQGGTVVLNRDSYSPQWLPALDCQTTYFFSLHSEKADYYASDICTTPFGTQFKLHTPQNRLEVNLSLIGMHNVTNAIAAAALAQAVGATDKAITEGLGSLKPIKGRLYPIRINANQCIWDDTYNANSASMCAAIAVLAQQPGYRVLVAGDMGELGDAAEACHAEVGKAAYDAQIDAVLSIGNLSKDISRQHPKGQHFKQKTDLINYLRRLLAAEPYLTILVKGSRSMAMEQIIDTLLMEQ